MKQNRWSRRKFLQKTGQAAGTVLAGGGVLGAAIDALAEGASPGLALGSGRGSAPSLNQGTKILRGRELENLLADLVGDLNKKGLYASAFFEERTGVNANANRGEKSAAPNAPTAGVVLQVYDGHHFHEASTDRVSSDSLFRLAKGLAKEVRPAPSGAHRPDPGPRADVTRQSPREIDPTTVSLSEWRRQADQLLEAVHAHDDRIRSAATFMSYRRRETLFVNPTRRIRQDILHSSRGIFSFAMDGGATARAFNRDVELAGFELIDFPQERFAVISELIDDLLKAERIVPGSYEVISSPAVTGLLAHESFGHGVEADQFVKGRAKAAHFLGKRVAPEWVNIWDDPSEGRANGSYYFDDEGWEASPTHIVKDGIFEQPLTDLFSSQTARIRRTANGRRQSFGNKAYARMSNTFFGRGSTPVAEMEASMEDGIFLDGFQSGIEDPHGWGIQLTVNRGYEIKNGKRTGRVFHPIGVTGYVPDILDSISQVSNEFALVPGTCGKGYKEYVPVASGGPHLKFRAQLG